MFACCGIGGRSGGLTPDSAQPPTKEKALFSLRSPGRVAPVLGVVVPEVWAVALEV